MSANPTYKLELVRSSDVAVLDNLDEATSRKLQLAFNKPGTLSLDVPIGSQVASYMAVRSTGAIVSRNGGPVWSGSLTTISDDAASERTSVTFTGWLEELDHRFVRASEVPSLTFTSVAGGTIAQALIAAANAQQDSSGTTRPTHVVPGSVADVQTRTRAYKAGDNYGNVLRELVEIENGLDLRVDPLTRTFSTRAPTAFADRTGVQFGRGVTPHNLAGVTRTIDGTTVCNRENVVTAGGVVVVADDPVAISNAGVMLEEWISISDVNDVTIAGAYANAELVYKRYGTTTYQVVPQTYGDLPRPWDDYDLGDQVYLSVDVGRFRTTNLAVRVFSLSISIDDNGNEVVDEMGLAAT